MEEIAAHPDFGKRNPVDIGIECGYQEESVVEMICYFQENKDTQGTEEEQGEGREKFYFLLSKKDLQSDKAGIRAPVQITGYKNTESKKHMIVAVNINNWKLEEIKDVEKPFLFWIKENIYAWADHESRTYLKW